MASLQTPPAARQPGSPKSPSPTVQVQRPVNDMRQYFAAVEQSVNSSVQGDVWKHLIAAFGALNVQLDAWASSLGQHADVMEAHHTSFWQASKAVKQLSNKENELSTGAAQKFVSIDVEMADLRRYLNQKEQKDQETSDRLAFEIKNKVSDIEANFGRMQNPQWVELVGKEVEKHAGAFALLAGQASAQSGSIKSLKDEMDQVKAVVDQVVLHVQSWESELAPQAAPVPTAHDAPTSQAWESASVRQTGPVPPGYGAPPGVATLGMGQAAASPEPTLPDPWDPWKQGARDARPAPKSFADQGFHEDQRSKFSEKVAVMSSYQYDGEKGGAQWRLMMKHYLIGKAPEMELILRDVDAHEDTSAMIQDLARRLPGGSLQQVQKLSRDLWAFLTLNLQGNARLMLNNSATLDGFELWRRLMKTIRSRCEIRRHELLGKLQHPELARSISEIPLALERWDPLLREYLESGGRRLSFEERRAALLMIPPPKFREDIFFRIPAMQDMADSGLSEDAQDLAATRLRAQVQRQAELTVQWSAVHGRTEQPAHVLGEVPYGQDPYTEMPYE